MNLASNLKFKTEAESWAVPITMVDITLAAKAISLRTKMIIPLILVILA